MRGLLEIRGRCTRFSALKPLALLDKVLNKKYWVDLNHYLVSIGQQYRNNRLLAEFLKKNKIINLQSKPIGWAVVFELAVKSQAAGLKLGEVPIISIDRLYGGKSTFNLGPWFGEYLRWFIWGIIHLHGIKQKKKLVRIPESTAL